MALVRWTNEQRRAFLQMQFSTQTKHYQTHYPTAEYYTFQQADHQAIGRITLEVTDTLLIMDLALLPEFQDQGIGSLILGELMNRARQDNVPLILRVEFFNSVIHLYSRPGFVKTKEIISVYHEMIWKPAPTELEAVWSPS